MNLTELINDKTKKGKEKVATISKWLLEGTLPIDELIIFAEKATDPVKKGTCIEAIEFATKENPTIADISVLEFATKTLTFDAPKVKWESARVIGNIAHLFPAKLNKTISNLLKNTEHNGTVVRWGTAFALGEILKLKSKNNKVFLQIIQSIFDKEQNSGVKKQYLNAIKKIQG